MTRENRQSSTVAEVARLSWWLEVVQILANSATKILSGWAAGPGGRRSRGIFAHIARRIVQAQPRELAALGWGFAWFFFLLLAYYVLRPVRETMGIVGGTKQLQWLFLATFLSMLVAVPLYAALVARLPRRLLVRIVYRFFAVNLILFWLTLRAGGDHPPVWAARAFFVWVSVFNLFAVSLFWSVMADVFSSSQGKRLFGFIAGGGTLGAFFGSLVAGQFVKIVEVANLLLIPVLLLEVSVFCAAGVDRAGGHFRRHAEPDEQPESQPTGGGVLAGITHVARSGYLLGICGYLLLASLCATTLYFQQAEIVEASVSGVASRTQLFANINLAVQVLTFFLQVLVTGRLLRWFGVAFALAVLPALYVVGFGAISTLPILSVLIAVEVLRRVATYGIAVPAREVLFTVVSREDKYKSKGFIDTVVVRGGDAATAQIFFWLRAAGLGVAGVANAMIPMALVWCLLGWLLGRRQQQLAASRTVVADRTGKPDAGQSTA